MMKKRFKDNTFSEKLSSLIQTKPSVIESDDEDLTTVDKIATNENDSDFSAEELEVSKFRKLNDKLLDEDDTKYSGKGVSRKDLRDSDSDESEDEASAAEEDKGSLTDDSEAQSSDISLENDVDLLEGEKRNNAKVVKNKKSEDKNFNKELLAKAAEDIEKGKGIKNQLLIWDFLLDCRMKFQKCLLASNQFPNHKHFMKFKNNGGPDFQLNVIQCKKSLRKLLNNLLALQNCLLKSNETYLSTFLNNNNNNITNDNISALNNEEIPSGSDNENDDSKSETDLSDKKFKKLNEFAQEIDKRHKNFKNYRDSVIQKWNDKTRLGSISNKNFSAFEQSTLKQIDHVLLDKQRLIKRTQTKRSNYHILGENDDEPPVKSVKLDEETSTNLSAAKSNSLHKEIFDDDDFYHQLLNELVKRKANDMTDPIHLGRQWMQLQKIRSKMKKTVDTKASKGRKVRYVVHPKLVNFMMPIDNSVYNEEARTELINSLFGRNKK